MTSPVSGGFQFTPATGLNDTTAYPTTPANETAARQQFMDLYWQLMNEMNNPTLSAAAFAQYNKLINVNFDIWQRGNFQANPASGKYTADRFVLFSSMTGGTLPGTINHRQTKIFDLPGGTYTYRLEPNAAGTLATDNVYMITQKIENGTAMLCGTGRKITISFYARSNLPGKKIGVYAQQTYGSGGTPSVAENLIGTTFTLTSSWAKYTLTLTTNQIDNKVFGTNNDDTLFINFVYAWGTGAYAGVLNASVAETFGGNGNVDIAQVQVCAGDVALPFQPRSFADELALCLRYFEKSYDHLTAPGTASVTNGLQVMMLASNTIPIGQRYPSINFRVMKRIPPTLTIYPFTTPANTGRVSANDGSDLAALSGAQAFLNHNSFTLYNNSGAALTTFGNIIYFHYSADAEL